MTTNDLYREAAERVAGDIAALGAMRTDWERDGRRGLHEMVVASWIVRAQQHLVLRIEALIAPLGLTMTKYECLVVLLASKNGALGMNKMAERLGVHPTSITYAIDSLVDMGLVERRPHPADRRRKLAALTDAGRSTVEHALGMLESDRFGVQPLGREKLDHLADLLQAAITPSGVDEESTLDRDGPLPPLTHRTRGAAAGRAPADSSADGGDSAPDARPED